MHLLGEVCGFQRGLTYKKADEVTSGGTVVLRAKNVSLDRGELDFKELRRISEKVDVPPTKRIRRDSLLIRTVSGSRSHLGKVALIDTDKSYALGGFMGLISPGQAVNPKFLYWLTQSAIWADHLTGVTAGANSNNLKFKDIASLPIPLPPLEEQRRIVAVLDEAFEGLARARANIEANLADAEDVFDAFLTERLGRVEEDHAAQPLSKLCSRITVGHVGSMASRYVDDGVHFLRSQNIRPFRVDLTEVKFVDAAFDAELKKSRLRPGDVAIVRTGYPGTSAVIPNGLEANCADLVIATPGPDLEADFLALFLSSSFGKAHVGSNLVGAAQKHFNVTKAKRTPLALPPKETQMELVKEAHAMRTQCNEARSAYHAQLADLDALRQSLLARAFRGELT